VQGRGESKGDEDTGGGQSAVVSRRIKDQARWRATDDKIALLEKAKEAEELEAQGQYDVAEQKLAEAQELGDRLALLEQSESQEQTVYNQALSSSSLRVVGKKKRKVSRESAATKGGKKVDDFEGDDVAVAGPISAEPAAPPPPPPPPEPMPTPEQELVLENLDNGVDRAQPLEAKTESKPARNRRDIAIKAPDPNAELASPVATASAVSVHVPAIGEAVLYQHMLLPEGQTLSVHLEARRHRKSDP
jgi:hypothetical protein